MAHLLQATGLEAHYGASQALFGVDLNIATGEVVALMGRNGMGKTTTIRTICRMTPLSAGSVFLEGADLGAMRSHHAARAGLGLVPEGRRCFPNLSVQENLTAAARTTRWSQAWTLDTVTDLFPRLAERATQKASSLSGGEQQMLAIGRALMTNPRLLILDEATEGLAPTVRSEIWAAIRSLKSSGLSILIVDKSLKDLMSLADQCAILERGRTVWAGVPAELTDDVTSRLLGV
ncbi:MAG: ABC transporter ATP-binding protein [Pseudomonadota bacterium]